MSVPRLHLQIRFNGALTIWCIPSPLVAFGAVCSRPTDPGASCASTFWGSRHSPAPYI
jgi:hypothetical protein